MATTKVTLTGPIFDGTAVQAAEDFTRALAAELAAIGRDWIKLDTGRMDRSGRGGSGGASSGVKIAGTGANWVISGGISRGVYAWPWLEGTSKRNKTTGFKGYGSFRRTRLRMRTQATPYAQKELEGFIGAMGGEG